MQKYNLVNSNNSSKPNYDVFDIEPYFNFYLSPQDEVCIIGVYDNNYIFWASITKKEDTELNAAIIEFIYNNKFKTVSNEYLALKSRYAEIKEWYKFSVQKEEYYGQRRYYSPVDGAFLEIESKGFSRSCAGGIRAFYRKGLELCDFRVVDTGYDKILERYNSLLTKQAQSINDCYDNYYQTLPLVSILTNESYLRICKDEYIRNLYIDCMNKAASLYNAYMTAAR